MPATRLWQRVVRFYEKRKETEKIEWQKRAFEMFTLSRSISYGLTSNRDLPPTRKEHNKKKLSASDWAKIEESRAKGEQFNEKFQEGHASVYHFCEFMGLPNFFDKPKEAEAKPPRTLGSFSKNREGRAEQKKAVKAMEQRMLAALDKIIEEDPSASRSQFGGESSTDDRPKPAGMRADVFAEQQGLV